MLRKREPKVEAPKARPLGPDLSFLDVVADTCARGARFTVTAEGPEGDFTVLVDRGGPFNAAGTRTTGAAALEAAATLRSGMYTVHNGWPMEQPLYQIGLDKTLARLLGNEAPAADDLPEARGVDALRAAGTGAIAGNPAPAGPVPAAPAGPVFAALPSPVFGAPASPAFAAPFAMPMSLPEQPAMAPAPSSSMAPPTVTAPPEFRPPQPLMPMPMPAPMAMPAPAIAPTPVSAEPQLPSHHAERALIESLHPVEPVAPDPLAPGAAGSSQAQGRLKHLVTQALLWLVQIDGDGSRYTLAQAAGLVKIALAEYGYELRANFSYFYHRVIRHQVDRVKDDWRKSGQVAARRYPQPGAVSQSDEVWEERLG